MFKEHRTGLRGGGSQGGLSQKRRVEVSCTEFLPRNDNKTDAPPCLVLCCSRMHLRQICRVLFVWSQGGE
jgi:hypothetical protein